MATYCTADDVRRVLQVDFDFSSQKLPTDTDVEASIEEAEDEIDQETQHAWRAVTVTNEFYDIPIQAYREGVGTPIHLKHRNVRTLASGSGDKLEVWDGSSYEDWLTTKTEGRANDYWLDEELGILYIRRYWKYYWKKAIRMTYRYGESTVPKDIRKATAMLAAIDFIMSDDLSASLNETGDSMRVGHESRIEIMRERVEKIIRNRREIPVF